LWEVQEARAAEPVVVVQREPEELLLDALHDVNQVLQQIKADLPGGSVNPILLPLAGDWLDRLSRLGKIAVDLSRKLHERLGWLAEDRVATLWGHLAAIVEASPLSAQQRLTLWESRFDGLLMGGRRFGCRGMRFTAGRSIRRSRWSQRHGRRAASSTGGSRSAGTGGAECAVKAVKGGSELPTFAAPRVSDRAARGRHSSLVVRVTGHARRVMSWSPPGC
jgi:hypothetical protein